MSVIYSIGTAVPEHELKQDQAKELVQELLPNRRLSKYLAVFDSANIDQRYFAAEPKWFQKRHGLEERHQLFLNHGTDLAEEAVLDSLKNTNLKLEDIDAIITVTSTGILTPPLEVHLLNRLPFNDSIKRYPFFGLGCAGGGVALSRAHEYLKANPTHAVMVVSVELASVAFHHDALDQQNIVGAALFSDGSASAVLLGEEHRLLSDQSDFYLHIKNTSSKVLGDSMDVMGWNIRDDGFYVIFDTVIPKLIPTFWKNHLDECLEQNELNLSDFEHILAHPGGRKVIEEIEKILSNQHSIQTSKNILRQYGNMSSPTVLFVIKDALENAKLHSPYHLITALGPGFTSEIIIAEWKS
ncbi:type III polyketide synthase [Aquisalibacillus elongatus]|uniref:15-methylpalmitoyl-4-hydroxy-2-pyrone synthase n=1 Tax=Aquisalibacillus elongatus TaxID=485577 RepID=A0A3N5BKM7_9BACI|nr:3-oxoacyl-[acyl-carrier-protein] synthase III C-terminal domain-containing protein [Aquisalibacillus elongatus]RPF55810.1 15-methylpalmitoyl-4-hydroxy-2-pyrone synthase [Aquisalibacillus elongatus]